MGLARKNELACCDSGRRAIALTPRLFLTKQLVVRAFTHSAFGKSNYSARCCSALGLLNLSVSSPPGQQNTFDVALEAGYTNSSHFGTLRFSPSPSDYVANDNPSVAAADPQHNP
jgi:hypothetical protein